MSTQRYLVTARKYRPQLFCEIVAQEHVTGTLKNALRLDRLAHAYLFSGPRGVGKTTAARILAKAINCTTPPEEREDRAEPCRRCDSCRSFEDGRSLNIIEIDAASNNKVEDIRELRETVRVPPQGSRKKVYIIDEVHMLSNAAFNALLKTLEEPPPHVLFIFATTEPNKVLPTILSRCQRFDFRRIAVPEIVQRLRLICEEEQVTADEAALMLIARKGDGALRDSLSAFDQAVSLCGTDLTYPALAEAFGVVDLDLYFDVTRAAKTRDHAGMLALVERIVRAGYDLQEFLVGLAEHLRNLLVARTMPDTELIEAAEATRRRYAETSEAFDENDLLHLLMLTSDTEEAVKVSTQPRLKLEVMLLKMASLAPAVDLREALQMIERLEARLQGVPEPPTPSHPASSSTPAAPPATQATRSAARAREEPPPPSGPRQEAPVPEPPRQEAARQEAPEEVASKQEPTEQEPASQGSSGPESPLVEAAPVDDVEAHPAPPPEPGAPPRSAPEPPAEVPQRATLFGTPALRKGGAKRSSSGDGGAPQALLAGSDGASVAEAAGGNAPAVLAVAPDAELGGVAVSWPQYVRKIKEERIHVGALLQHAVPLERRDGSLVLAVPDAFHQRMLETQQAFLLGHVALLEASVERLRFVVRNLDPETTPAETAPEIDPYEYLQEKRRHDPVVRAIFDQFGGEPVW